MTIGFLMAVVASWHGNYIRSIILKVFDRQFRRKSKHDYPVSVFIGYADRDYRFPCFRLLPFVESLNLTTFVNDRDLQAGPDAASGVMAAVQTCWRVVLVVTESFLEDDQLADFTSRAAIFSQNPSDPHRIAVVTSEDLRDRLPVHLLAAVTDDRVLYLDTLAMCGQLRQFLTRFLLKE